MILLQNPRVLARESLPRAYRERAAARALRPALGSRVLARLRGRSLDRALIAGADPSTSPLLAARAAALAAQAHRHALADGLERLLAAAEGPQRRWWALSAREHVRANASEISALAELLRGSTPLYARGIAMVEDLLSDGAGPAYDGPPTGLAARLRAARSAMAS